MHRTMEIAAAPAATEGLLRELQGIDEVVGLAVQRGASLKPPGDVVSVQVLNRGADAVLKAVAGARERGPVSVATAELASLSDPAHQDAVDRDVDEAIWEELETGLRHQGRVTSNFLALMALGGALATAGLVSDPVSQALALAAAAIVAPGFEPIAKLPLGLVLGRWKVVRRGLVSTLAGYAALAAAAAATFLLLRATTDAVTAEGLLANPGVHHVAHPTGTALLVSACGALAGVVIQAAYRRSVIAGALVAMRVVDAAALAGVAVAIGDLGLALDALRRLGIDVALIVAAGLLVFGAKQAFFHRRRPLH